MEARAATEEAREAKAAGAAGSGAGAAMAAAWAGVEATAGPEAGLAGGFD